MDIPGIVLNGAQRDQLNALILRGQPDLMVIDQKVNGQDVYLLLACGASRDWIQQLVSGIEKPEPSTEYVPSGPPAKIVKVTTGAQAAQPGGGGPV